ncbi:MAG: hypothetical protein ACLUS6_16715 [Dysosmobacter sp.]
MLLAAGCADWEVTEDPLGELSDFYQNENEEPEPEPLTAFTLPYIAGGTLDPVRTTGHYAADRRVPHVPGAVRPGRAVPAPGRPGGQLDI